MHFSFVIISVLSLSLSTTLASPTPSTPTVSVSGSVLTLQSRQDTPNSVGSGQGGQGGMEMEMNWPRDAAGWRRSGESNADRIKRGLNPSRPRKLYQPEVVKRVAGAPDHAQASAGVVMYNLEGCYNGGNELPGSQTYTIDSTSLADLANQCASKQDMPGGSTPGSFYISQDGTCYTSVVPLEAPRVDCTTDNYAYYTMVARAD